MNDRPALDETLILIVDDHPIMRRGLSILFEGEGFKVLEAQDERSALQCVTQSKPRVVILDLILREGESLHVINKIRNIDPTCDVLVYSGSDEVLQAERVLHAGAQGYVMKGGKMNDIVDAVRCVLGGRIYLSERMRERRRKAMVR